MCHSSFLTFLHMFSCPQAEALQQYLCKTPSLLSFKSTVSFYLLFFVSFSSRLSRMITPKSALDTASLVMIMLCLLEKNNFLLLFLHATCYIGGKWILQSRTSVSDFVACSIRQCSTGFPQPLSFFTNHLIEEV